MNGESNWRDTIICIIVIFIIFFLVIISHKCENSESISTRPDIVNVDSLLNTNDSIKVVIKYIDSTKHEEIEKVLKLDNDSTLELFKKLVSE